MDLPEDFAETCAEAFYEELFRRIPAARKMFTSKERMRSMFSVQLYTMLTEAGNPSALRQSMRDLGARHRQFGIMPIHIKAGRQAFLSAVEKAAPDIAADDLKFFEKAYDEIAEAMS